MTHHGEVLEKAVVLSERGHLRVDSHSSHSWVAQQHHKYERERHNQAENAASVQNPLTLVIILLAVGNSDEDRDGVVEAVKWSQSRAIDVHDAKTDTCSCISVVHSANEEHADGFHGEESQLAENGREDDTP